MQEVHIFLVVSSHAPRMKRGSYHYMLCCPGSSKPPLEGRGQEKNITGHRLILKCAVAAMDRMTRSAVITIHTDSEYLAEGHGRLASWRENDWKKSNGQKIRNSDLWKLLGREVQAPCRTLPCGVDAPIYKKPAYLKEIRLFGTFNIKMWIKN